MARRLARDDRGQMMLLAAVVMIFAFLALASMVARVTQLASVTTQDQDRAIHLEVGVVADAVDGLILDLQGVTPTLNATSTPTFEVALANGLRHLAHLETARGFDLAFEIDCTLDLVRYQLDDGEVRVSLVSTTAFAC